MKEFYLSLVCIFSCSLVFATNKYWVGPINGKWSNSINWSLTSGGPGGASVPGSAAVVIFDHNARVNVDVSPTISSLLTNFSSTNVVLYTLKKAIVLTILNNLTVDPFTTLKDSTAANVSFNVVFNSATHATGSILGNWIFEGGVSLSGTSSPGASFVAGASTVVTVTSIPTYPIAGGRIVFKKNTKKIVSSEATLHFDYNSYYELDNNLNATIPVATWAKDSVRATDPYDGFLSAPASTILVSGNMKKLKYLGGVPNYGRMVIDLPNLTADASLALPDGSKIRGNLEILNTNNQTLTLLASQSAASSMQVEVGTHEAGHLFGGYLLINGTTTLVALARANAAAPSTSYKLLVNKSYNQSGGNFSLQDYDGVTGTSTLDIKDDFIQTGGTFVTKSNSGDPTAKFLVIMDDPNFNASPSGDFQSSRVMNVSSGTIDNGSNKITLRIFHTVYNIIGFGSDLNGVVLQSPLKVGRLELAASPLTTTIKNIIAVTDPGVNAIAVGGTGKSYVNGPLIRATNSVLLYGFPTGKGNSTTTGYTFDSCVVIPNTSITSSYQAEFFKVGYPDVSVKAPLEGVSQVEYWNISRNAGSDAQVGLILNAAIPGVPATKGLVVANYDGSDWIKVNGKVLTPGNSSSGFVTSKLLTTFGAFTFGFGNPKLLGVIISILPVNSLSSNSTNSGMMENEKGNIETPKIYPNPFAKSFTIDFYNSGNVQDKFRIDIYDLSGKIIYTYQPGSVGKGHNSVIVDLGNKNLAAGVYVAQLRINGISSYTVKMVKGK